MSYDQTRAELGLSRDDVARLLYFRRNPCEFPENEDFAWKCAQQHPPEHLVSYFGDADAILAAAQPKNPS